jgi:hypothetical protein
MTDNIDNQSVISEDQSVISEDQSVQLKDKVNNDKLVKNNHSYNLRSKKRKSDNLESANNLESADNSNTEFKREDNLEDTNDNKLNKVDIKNLLNKLLDLNAGIIIKFKDDSEISESSTEQLIENNMNTTGNLAGVNLNNPVIIQNPKEICINAWLKNIPKEKQRTVKKMCNKLYDNVFQQPKIEEILLSKMPFNEKCNSIEQFNILNYENLGPSEYYKRKKELIKKINNYNNMSQSARQLENIEKKSIKLFKVQDSPLKMQILTSNISDYNKTVLLEKLSHLDTMFEDNSKAKLNEWINWGLKISDNIMPLEVGLNSGELAINKYLYNIKSILDTKIYKMTNAKEKLLELLAMRIINPDSKSMSLALCGPPGVGKCLHPDTQILLFFGGMKAAKDIKKGDILIGDDYTPRIVMNTTEGTDKMYKIIPEMSDTFIVNEPHVMTLYDELINCVVDIPLNEFMQKTESYKNRHSLFSIPIEYQRQDIKNDPYMIGVLLNSKSKNIEDIMKEYLNNRLENISKYINGVHDVTSLNLSAINNDELAYLINNRYIPDEYLFNTREIRFKLLHGFLDAYFHKNKATITRSKSAERSIKKIEFKRSRTPKPLSKPPKVRFENKSQDVLMDSLSDTSDTLDTLDTTHRRTESFRIVNSNGYAGRSRDINSRSRDKTSKRLDNFKSKIPVLKKHELIISIKDKILNEQIKFLLRSLGYSCISIADEITIYDDISKLPELGTRKEMKFTVMSHNENNYCGFTLTGNGRFLLASGVVTHNTQLMQVFAECIKQPFVKINMGGTTDPSYFLGHAYTYEGSAPGVIVKAISNMKIGDMRTKSGILLFDEFDKLGHKSKVGDAFLHISDPVQQKDFKDEYMPEIKVDLSNITFVYSMNNKNNIDFTLLNRLPVIEVNGYSSKEKHDIIKNYLIPRELENFKFTTRDITFDDNAIKYIIDNTQSIDKNGIRKVLEVIQSIIKKINAVRCVSHVSGKKIFSYQIDNFKLPFTVTEKVIDNLKVINKTEMPHLSMYL